jgi:hypothetical protein
MRSLVWRPEREGLRSPLSDAASPPGSCPRGGGSPRTGLTFRRAGSRRRQVGHRCSPTVPPACHRSGHERYPADSHGHSERIVELRARSWPGRTSAPEASTTGRLEPSVRAGSVPYRKPAGIGGHKRSGRVRKNRRSAPLHSPGLGRSNRVAQSSSLPTRLAGTLRRAVRQFLRPLTAKHTVAPL